ncbi:hypothetical protein E4T56_gene20922, partial [Termitomyces sp. T112]
MEGLRWPILAAVLSFSLLLVLLLALLMREHEVQLVEMRLFADFWNLVDLDPGHSVNLTLPDDSVVPMTIGDVPDYPDVVQAWTKFMRCMIVALVGSLFFSGPLATWASGIGRPAEVGEERIELAVHIGLSRLDAEQIAQRQQREDAGQPMADCIEDALQHLILGHDAIADGDRLLEVSVEEHEGRHLAAFKAHLFILALVDDIARKGWRRATVHRNRQDREVVFVRERADDGRED